MAVIEQTPIKAHTGNGVTTVFAYDFLVLDDDDMLVLVDGVAVSSALYTVGGVGVDSGGTVTFTTAPASNADVVLIRDSAVSRVTDYQSNGDLLAAVINRDFDRLWLVLQEIIEGSKGSPRSLRAPAGEVVDDLPPAAERADMLLSFDTDGQPIAVAAAAGTASALSVDLASTASGKGAALVGFRPAGTGISTTLKVQDKLRETISVKDFGATGDGITNDATAIAAAITYAASLTLGGAVYFPAGVYISTSTTFDVPDNVMLFGDGQRASTVFFKGTGDGFTSLGTINAPANIRLVIHDLGIICDNAGNTGAGLVQMGGMLCELVNCYFYGFKYGAVLNQTELSTLERCQFDTQSTTGLWIVNGGDYASYPTGSQEFTNRITVSNCSFNQAATAYCVVDDGGLSHVFRDCTFNAGLRSIRIAGVQVCSVADCYFEFATQENILIASTTLAGTSVNAPASVSIRDNLFLPAATKNCIVVTTASSLILVNNNFSSALSAAAAVSITTLSSLIAIGNRNPNAYSLGSTAFYRIMDIFAAASLYIGSGAVVGAQATLTFGASVDVNADSGNTQLLICTNATAPTINAPTGAAQAGHRITIRVKNTSGGAMGTITWNAIYKMSTWTNPATGFSRSVDFEYDGTNWVQVSQTGVDVPN
jgi:hypothetical protein